MKVKRVRKVIQANATLLLIFGVSAILALSPVHAGGKGNKVKELVCHYNDEGELEAKLLPKKAAEAHFRNHFPDERPYTWSDGTISCEPEPESMYGSIEIRAIGFGEAYNLYSPTNFGPPSPRFEDPINIIATAASPDAYDQFECNDDFTLDEEICIVQNGVSLLRAYDSSTGFDGMYQICRDRNPLFPSDCGDIFTLQPNQNISCDDSGGTITCGISIP